MVKLHRRKVVNIKRRGVVNLAGKSNFKAELLKVCYEVDKARINASFLEQLKGDNQIEAIADFTIAMSELDEAYEEAKKTA